MEPPSPYSIDILDDSGLKIAGEPLAVVLRAALADLGLPPGELSVRLTGDDAVRALNMQYRGLDETTDVLTFSAEGFPSPPDQTSPLGDVVISVPQAARQAQARGYGLEDELAYLGLHGVLHLAGYDDETEEDRAAMLAKMDAMGARLGLPSLGDWQTLDPIGAAR